MIAPKETRLTVETVLNVDNVDQNFIFGIFFWIKAIAVVMMYSHAIKDAI